MEKGSEARRSLVVREPAASDVANVEEFVASVRQKGARSVVMVAGIFNVLHPGHFRLLRFAREQGEVLIAGVLCNALAPSAVVDEQERLQGVAELSLIDCAFLIEEPLTELLARLRPEVVVKGREWAECQNPEEEVLSAYGGRLLFSSGEAIFSSLELMRREYLHRESFSPSPQHEYLTRHGITAPILRDTLTAFDELKVLVLGDLIVDEYLFCDALGMSQEDPVLVVRPLTQERYVGGAGIVALHARGLGASVRFCTVVGPDEIGTWARERLEEKGVETHCLLDTTRPTTLKQRFVSQNKKLLRVSYLREHAVSSEIHQLYTDLLQDLLKEVDLVIFSDFNYGFLCEEIRRETLQRCQQAELFTAADCQSSSQLGDVSRYVGVELVTPTEREARLALHDRESGLVVLARSLERKMQARHLLLTLGKDGILIHQPTAESYETDTIPPLNPQPKDLLGAGDALLVGSAMALAAGRDIWTAAYVGSMCAAYEVASTGNQPLLKKDVLSFLAGPLS